MPAAWPAPLSASGETGALRAPDADDAEIRVGPRVHVVSDQTEPEGRVALAGAAAGLDGVER